MLKKEEIYYNNKDFNIIKNLLPKHKRKSPPNDSEPILFGSITTDHMLICDYLPQKGGWQHPEIVPYKPFTLNPSAVVFHYGQTIFEGMKAYQEPNDKKNIYLFRPQKNAERMKMSALRMGMEPFPEELFLFCVKELIKVDRSWVLPYPGSLYVRPSMIALDEGISYRASKTYRFFIIMSPAQNYFQKDTGVSVYIERNLSRAALGGSGEAKCGGNYAAALPPMFKAHEKGAEQVLWLDSNEHKYVEEAGAMNVFFVYSNKVVTPALSGSILHGITRDSVLALAKHKNLEVEEKRIPVNQILNDIEEGSLTEAFACGTAAVITPITCFVDDNKNHIIQNGKIGQVTKTLKQELIGIQTGISPDPFGWRISLSE